MYEGKEFLININFTNKTNKKVNTYLLCFIILITHYFSLSITRNFWHRRLRIFPFIKKNICLVAELAIPQTYNYFIIIV